MTKVHESVHVLNLLYDHKDYANFDNAVSIIMTYFPEPIGLQTNSSLEDGNESEISNWERDVLNLRKDRAKIIKNLIFQTTLLILFNNCEGGCPKIFVYLKGEFEYDVLQTLRIAVQEFSPYPLYQYWVDYVFSTKLNQNIPLKSESICWENVIFSLTTVSHMVYCNFGNTSVEA